ncbi:MAG TPA: ABC transporter ATP-binding protein [Chlamydiales bacterium]|nr:ABC transporter ATP-binding protein [Chlamydiales bacterium]
MFSIFKKIRRMPLFPYFLGEKNKNVGQCVLVLAMNLTTALMEGVSFGSFLVGLSYLNADASRDFHGRILNHLHLSDFLSQRSAVELFLLFILLGIFFQAVKSAASYLSGAINTKIFVGIQETIQVNVLHRIFRFSFPFVNRYKIGDLIEYAKSPSLYLTTVMDHVHQVNVNFFMILITFGLMVFLSKLLTLVTFLGFGFFALFQKFFIKKIAHESQRFTQFSTDFNQELVQGLQAIRLVHLFNRKDHILKKVSIYLKDFGRAQKKAAHWNNAFTACTEIVGISIVGAILMMGYLLMKNNSSSPIPILLTFIGLAYRLTFRAQMMLRSVGQITMSAGTLQRLNNILSEEDKDFVASSGLPFKEFTNEIRFQNVVLKYPQTTREVIQEISFTIPKGKTVALVGSSGAGKSSLLDLLLRLYEPVKGEILVDGLPLQSLDINEWRSKIGVVTQDIFIFNDTILANILFGSLEASRDEVIEAAKAAGAHDFIQSMPNGYDTVVGERGYRLSGGERQRIALARALIRKPCLLILDEATSSLDTHSEKIIQETLHHLKHTVSMLIVAHRLSTIVHADQILVVEKGKIIESGVHQELVKKQGRYAYLWRLQSEELKLKQLLEENEKQFSF